MKLLDKLLLLACICCLSNAAYSQAPQLINYQAVARDAAGTPLTNQAVSIRFDIHDGSPTGSVQYQETQSATTNAYGLFNVQVGNGIAVVGTMASVTWSSGNKYLQVELDPTGGSSYVDMGTQQLVSVPYALYADNAATTAMAGDVTGTNATAVVAKIQGSTVSATIPVSGQVLQWSSGAWTPVTPTWGSVASVIAGAGLSGGTITTSGTISLPNVGIAGTYGSATQVPVITTDAQGRVSAVTNTTITVPSVSGTVKYVPVFTSATSIGNSRIVDNGIGYGTVIGYDPAQPSTATGFQSVAMGGHCTASGADQAFAQGYHSTANGTGSVAMGSYVSNGGFSGAFYFADFGSLGVTNSNTATSQMMMRFEGGYKLFSNANATVGTQMAAGGNSWSIISDRRKKENFAAVNGEDFLQKIAAFNLTSWNYKTQDPKLFRHYGPMAQDFYAAFGKDDYGLIGNDTTIGQADLEGVSFIAIQALEKRTREQADEIKELKAENALLKGHAEQVANISARLDELEASLNDKYKKVTVK